MLDRLQAPPPDYVALPPFRVVFEWPSGDHHLCEAHTLSAAMQFLLLGANPVGSANAPWMRLAYDLRAVTVFGFLADGRVVATDQAIAAISGIVDSDEGAAELEHLEMSIRSQRALIDHRRMVG